MVENGLPEIEQRRGIKPVDLLAFGGIALVFIGVTIGAVLTSQEWSIVKIAILVIVDAVGLGFVIAYFIGKWIALPDFTTTHGTAFWVNGLESPDLELMEKALDHFLKVMHEEQTEATEDQLRNLLTKTGVEWKRSRVSLVTSRWELRDKAGIQYGYRLLVQWPGSVADSAFYHELLHEVNQFIRRPKSTDVQQFDIDDIQHKEASWWRLEGLLVDDF